MKWIGITGSWRATNKQVEKDVRREVSKIIKAGNGIVTGGALNVDYFAADEVLKNNPNCNQIKIFLPTTLEIYSRHYFKRADEGVITYAQAKGLILLLTKIKEINPSSIIENLANSILDKSSYFQRNQDVVDVSDELLAFHVNSSEGVKDTINKAKKKNISIRIFEYKIK
ncbi:MAG: hypothetical protein ACD_58C00304G0015 [uncultured bacterium]|nr:MAG: hypothetical protein ACD_58C00304G0015 [uncultured bacterium]